MCWYQCPANNYITHYHVLAPIRVNLKLLYRNSCVLVQSTLQKCTTVWLTGKTQAASARTTTSTKAYH